MIPAPLVSAQWLAHHLDAETLRIADCRWHLDDPHRATAEYSSGHIPGAVFFSLDQHLSASSGPGRHPLPDRSRLAATLGQLGIGNQHAVVAYDTAAGAFAARMWWLLRWLGHREAAVLDGGLSAWTEMGGELSSGRAEHDPTSFVPGAPSVTMTDRSDLRGRLGEVVLIDARSAERYRGEHEPIDPVAGHIPTARSVPYSDNLASDGRFLDRDSLRERYLRAGVREDESAVVYCGSGVSACHDILAMELAGLPSPTLYPGSWSDWSTAGGPVATGPEA